MTTPPDHDDRRGAVADQAPAAADPSGGPAPAAPAAAAGPALDLTAPGPRGDGSMEAAVFVTAAAAGANPDPAIATDQAAAVNAMAAAARMIGPAGIELAGGRYGAELGPALLSVGWAVATLAAARRPLESEPGAALAGALAALTAGAALADTPDALTSVSALSTAIACLAHASRDYNDRDDLAGALQALAASARLAAGLTEMSTDPAGPRSPGLVAMLAEVAETSAVLASTAIIRRAEFNVSRETSAPAPAAEPQPTSCDLHGSACTLRDPQDTAAGPVVARYYWNPASAFGRIGPVCAVLVQDHLSGLKAYIGATAGLDHPDDISAIVANRGARLDPAAAKAIWPAWAPYTWAGW